MSREKSKQWRTNWTPEKKIPANLVSCICALFLFHSLIFQDLIDSAVCWSHAQPTHASWQGVSGLMPSPHTPPGEKCPVSCPARTHLLARSVWWTKSNFLLPKSNKDQWDCEINNICRTSLNNSKICSSPFKIRTFCERVGRKKFWMLLGYIVAKVWATPRNSTWFTRPRRQLHAIINSTTD